MESQGEYRSLVRKCGKRCSVNSTQSDDSRRSSYSHHPHRRIIFKNQFLFFTPSSDPLSSPLLHLLHTPHLLRPLQQPYLDKHQTPPLPEHISPLSSPRSTHPTPTRCGNLSRHSLPFLIFLHKISHFHSSPIFAPSMTYIISNAPSLPPSSSLIRTLVPSHLNLYKHFFQHFILPALMPLLSLSSSRCSRIGYSHLSLFGALHWRRSLRQDLQLRRRLF